MSETFAHHVIMYKNIKIFTFWHIVWQTGVRSNKTSAFPVVEIIFQGRKYFADLRANEPNSFIIQAW